MGHDHGPRRLKHTRAPPSLTSIQKNRAPQPSIHTIMSFPSVLALLLIGIPSLYAACQQANANALNHHLSLSLGAATGLNSTSPDSTFQGLLVWRPTCIQHQRAPGSLAHAEVHPKEW